MEIDKATTPNNSDRLVLSSGTLTFGSTLTVTTQLTTNAPEGGIFIYTDTDPLNPSGYYRLMQH